MTGLVCSACWASVRAGRGLAGKCESLTDEQGGALEAVLAQLEDLDAADRAAVLLAALADLQGGAAADQAAVVGSTS